MPQVSEVTALKDKIAALERQLAFHRTCPVYGILTRSAVEEAWEQQKRLPNLAIAFLDIDDLKQKNSELGQDETNRRINAAFAMARSGEVLVARFFSGDEFVILTPRSQIVRACDRAMTALRDRGVGATATIVQYGGEESLADAVRDAAELNSQCKLVRKGEIYNFLTH